MDFKVAGTKDGITAIQMDTKLKGLPFSIFPRYWKTRASPRCKSWM